MKKTGTILIAAVVLAACSNGTDKTNKTDSAIHKDSLAVHADSSNNIADSANALRTTARKMLDTVNTNISAVPLDSVKK